MTDVAENPTDPSDPGPAAVHEASDAAHRIAELTAELAARDSFISLVGHELRNSVAPMLLLAEQFAAVAQEPGAPALVTSRAAMLTRNLQKFVTTVDRVAEVANLRRGRLQLSVSEVDLAEVVGEVCREARREAAAGGIELELTADGPVIGQWDRARLKQIVASLVSNAIRYGGAGRVELRVGARSAAAELVVRDHGPGIDPAALPRLFEGFDHAQTRRAGGFGIGLWVVKTLCTAMQGSVTAENASEGGACFCVVLPRG
jgi:signal transduction histidine kinase